MAAVFGPFGDTSGDWFLLRPICGLVGLLILVWAWATDRRRRIEVTEQHVTVVNSFSRYVVVWHELSDIEFERIETEGGWTAYHRLAFVTPSRRIVAEAPAGSLPNPKHSARHAYRGEGGTQAPAPRPPELMKVRDRILHARQLSLNEPQADVGVAVEGAAAVADRLGARFPRVKAGLLVTVAVLSLAFTLFIGLGLNRPGTPPDIGESPPQDPSVRHERKSIRSASSHQCFRDHSSKLARCSRVEDRNEAIPLEDNEVRREPEQDRELSASEFADAYLDHTAIGRVELIKFAERLSALVWLHRTVNERAVTIAQSHAHLRQTGGHLAAAWEAESEDALNDEEGLLRDVIAIASGSIIAACASAMESLATDLLDLDEDVARQTKGLRRKVNALIERWPHLRDTDIVRDNTAWIAERRNSFAHSLLDEVEPSWRPRNQWSFNDDAVEEAFERAGQVATLLGHSWEAHLQATNR